MREDWTGFYGPAYRLILEYAGCGDLPDVAWTQAVRMHRDNPNGEGHWEFLALGYLHLFDRDRHLSSKAALRLTEVQRCFCSDHHATNWRLMAQVVQCRIEGRFLTSADLDRVRLKPASDGFLPDLPSDESSQYHAFLLFLLMRFSDPEDAAMRSHVTRALDWLVVCHRRFGDPSPLGRGRFQLFGYAAMAAAAAQAENWHLPVAATWLADVWSRLEGDHKFGAISPRWEGPHRRYLLHGYNTVEDYPAFTSLMTHSLLPTQPVPDRDDIDALWWHPLDNVGSCLLADRNGVRASILVSQTKEPAIGLRNLLRQLGRRVAAAPLRPGRVSELKPLPGTGIQVNDDDRNLRLDWALGKERGQFSDITLWSFLPVLNLVVTGSVEPAHLDWHQPDGRTWRGVDLRSVRAGRVQLTWGRQ